MSERPRFCIRCNAPITACFGFVLIRDMLPAFTDGGHVDNVREQCGKCVERPDAMKFVRMLKP